MEAPLDDCPNRAEAGASRLITALSASSKMISTRDVEGNEIAAEVEAELDAARRWAAFGNSAAFMTLTSSFGKRAQIGNNGIQTEPFDPQAAVVGIRGGCVLVSNRGWKQLACHSQLTRARK